MPENQREDGYAKMGNNRYGGYAQGNSGSGSYRGGKGGNAGRPRGSKAGNSRGGSKSSFASPEMQKAVWMVAAIPVTFVLLVVGYFTAAAFGAWS